MDLNWERKTGNWNTKSDIYRGRVSITLAFETWIPAQKMIQIPLAMSSQMPSYYSSTPVL
jgi:hypothetical protein